MVKYLYDIIHKMGEYMKNTNKLKAEDLEIIKQLFSSFNRIVDDFEKTYLKYDYKKQVKNEDIKTINEYRTDSALLLKKIENAFNSNDKNNNFTSKDRNLIYRILLTVNTDLSNNVGLIMLSKDDFANNIIKDTEKNNTAVFNITEIMC